MKNVLFATAGLFIGHILYGYLFHGDPNVSRAIEMTWHQFGAMALYWFLWGKV